MQHLKQGRVDDQGLRIAYQLIQDGTPQGLEEAPQLADTTVQRGRMEAYDPREEVREEPGSLAQEGAARLHASKLLEEGEGYDLRIREFLEGLVASPFGVEPVVNVVHSAEQNGQGSSRRAKRGVIWGWAI
jgi:hypothetical protein